MPSHSSNPRPKSSTFGSSINTRSFSTGSGFRFGFNGKEKQSEFSGDDYDFGARIYNGRLGRWNKCDFLFNKYPSYSPFHFGYDNSIITIDLNGEENIIVIGGQTRTESPKSDILIPENGYGKNGLYRRHFLEAGLNEAIRLKNLKSENNEVTTILVYKSDYSENEINYYTIQALKQGININFYNKSEDLVNYVNNKIDTKRSNDLITDFSYFGHGSMDALWIGFGTDYTELTADMFNSSAFSNVAEANLYGCNNGTQNDEFSTSNSKCSIGDQFCNNLNIETKAVNGYVWWGQNDQNIKGVGLFKPKDNGQFVTFKPESSDGLNKKPDSIPTIKNIDE